MTIIPRPRRHADQECEGRSAETDVERVVDVLGGVTGEKGKDAGYDEEGGGEGFDDGLAFEVLEG